MTNLKINHSHHNILEKRNFHFDMSTWLYLYKFVKPEGKQLNSRERKKNRNRSEHISKEWLYNQQNKEVWTTSLVSHSHSRFRSQNRDRTRDHDRNSDRRLTGHPGIILCLEGDHCHLVSHSKYSFTSRVTDC
ncbi:uncharacterized protein LOC143257319 isoform X17 [Tachypleus tridentatus]|uniref:uncharacterized protein LOC143257319 isoform X17 n=1 Tax=Tachypleus tridentatus TaxID=6853 RepID=UPI003FCFDEF0